MTDPKKQTPAQCVEFCSHIAQTYPIGSGYRTTIEDIAYHLRCLADERTVRVPCDWWPVQAELFDLKNEILEVATWDKERENDKG